MTTEVRRVPETGEVVREQIRAVGLAVRREALALTALVGVAALVTAGVMVADHLWFMVDGEPLEALRVDPGTELGPLAAVLGLLFPLAVWKNERRFGDTTLWTLPVDHRRHALVKVGAGWVWLMALVAVMLAWIGLMAMLTDGGLGGEYTRRLIVDAGGAAAAAPGAVESVLWRSPWWHFVLPFTAATAAYLIGSALWLGTRYPLIWVAALWLLGLGLAILSEDFGLSWARAGVQVVFGAMGEWAALRTRVTLPSGDRVTAWQAFPTFVQFAWAAVLTTGLGGVALFTGVARRRDR